MKLIGYVLFMVGVALAAAFGARNNPETFEPHMAVEGRATLLAGKAAEAKEAYCKALKERNLAHPGPCPEEKKAEEKAEGKKAEEKADEKAAEEKKPEAKKEPPPKPTAAQVRARLTLQLASWRKTAPSVAEDAGKLQAAWLEAESAAIEPAAAMAALPEPESPGERLSSWFAVAGLPFIGGVLLIIIGALLARRAAKIEAAAEPKQREGKPKARDFGEMLAELHEEVKATAAEMTLLEEPQPEDFSRIKQHVEDWQLEKIELMVEARGRLQARYGIGGFAAVFGPFASGERNVNRSWSALVDDHWPEAVASLELATADFADARAELDKLVAAAATS